MTDKKQTILIVDDSEMNRDILTEMLGSAYEIMEAEDGLEAVDILQRRMTDIDLILLDIMMPGMDGFEVLKFMKRSQLTEVIPVIMISSESSSSYIEKAYELGAADYINRPFNAAIVSRRVINTLMLYAKQKRLMQMVADQVYEREKNNDMMVNILSHIVEFRNGESGQHIRHIHVVTEIMLQHLQRKTSKYPMNQEDIVRIATASAIHDIGKISIPGAILNKPGKLTDEEYAVMKTHSMVGAEMLDALAEYKDTPFVQTAYEICRWHHERYDGRGYPDGLKGEEIPISAQVVSVADVYDALTSERCYKKAFSHEKAIEMIVNGECGQFNPLLMECFKEASDEIHEKLFQNPTGKTSDKQLSSVVEEILEHREIGESTYSGNHLERSQERTAFFNTWSNELRFDYNSSTGMLYFSDWGASILGLPKSNIDLEKEKYLLKAVADIDPLIQKVREKGPEDGALFTDVDVHGPEGIVTYHLIAKSLWTKDEKPCYMGTVGVAVLKGGKILGGGATINQKELDEMVAQLNKIFDIVRLVDVDKTKVVMPEQPHACYAVWKRNNRCANCISARVVSQKRQLTKIEFVDTDIYLVISQYVQVDGKEYALEMVSRLQDELMLGAYGRSELIDRIEQYNNRVCRDPLSKAYNRQYYEDQVCHMGHMEGVVMIDADDFKRINDAYGHQVGDKALSAYARAIFSVVRSTDILIRYGGDEFILLMPHVPKETFVQRLDMIRQAVYATKVEGYPQIQLSVSVGGAYGVTTVEEAIAAADKEMYKAKKTKNSVSVYEGGTQS